MPLALALMISGVLHAAAITMPGWDLPGQPDPMPPSSIETHLLPSPRPVPMAARAKALRSSATKKPAVEPAAAATPEPEAAVSTSASPPGGTDVDPSVVGAPADNVADAAAGMAQETLPVAGASPQLPWPSEGRVHYIVTYGEHGFVIGEMVHEWRIEDGRYTIRSSAEPTGLAVLRGRKRTQSSAGDVTAAGFRPREFVDQKEGREAESASFDWQAARVGFSGNRNGSALPEGTQDLLSMFYQLAWMAPRQTVELAVATSSRLGRWTFEWMGEQDVELPDKKVAALHLRTRSETDTIEVWLAPAYGGLPVKIRYVDRGGGVFEQTADSLG